MKTIVISNRKGGSSKTTTSINLASILAKKYSVLLIDLDTQGHCRIGLGVKTVINNGSHSIFKGNYLTENMISTSLKNLTLVPADESFDVYKRSIPMGIIKKRFEEESIDMFFDFCVIDTPPTYDAILKNALEVADIVIIPTIPHYLGIVSVEQMMKAIYQTNIKMDKKMPFIGILPIMFNPHIKTHLQVVSSIEKSFGKEKVFSPINIDIHLAKQFEYKKPIVLFDKRTRGAENYMQFTKELLEKIENI
jgi:chromosome partitioning protein